MRNEKIYPHAGFFENGYSKNCCSEKRVLPALSKVLDRKIAFDCRALPMKRITAAIMKSASRKTSPLPARAPAEKRLLEFYADRAAAASAGGKVSGPAPIHDMHPTPNPEKHLLNKFLAGPLPHSGQESCGPRTGSCGRRAGCCRRLRGSGRAGFCRREGE